MTTIETLCDRCGPVETTPRRVALRLGGPAASYRFRCPSCHRRVRRPADDTAVLLLVRAGVRPRGLARLRWGRPAATTAQAYATFASTGLARVRGRSPLVGHATRVASADALTWDDVVEFALRLGVEPTPAANAGLELAASVGPTSMATQAAR